MKKKKDYTTMKVERARHGFTQEKLAKEIKSSRQTIHAIETGRIWPGVRLAIKIARALKVTVEQLWGKLID